MPDWYVRRNEPEAPYPYSVRLGGCEYSLTEEEWAELIGALNSIDSGYDTYRESEDYKDIIIASGSDKPRLLDILKLAKPVINRRGM